MQNEREIKNSSEAPQKPARRSFLKLSAMAGVAATMAGTGMVKNARASDVILKEHGSLDDIYEIDAAKFKRFNPMDHMFMRGLMGDKGFEHIAGILINTPVKDEVGKSQLDRALTKSLGFVEQNFTGPIPQKFGFYSAGMYSWKQVLFPKKYQFESPEAAALAVKKTGKKLGAGLVGIAPFDERWLYTHALKFVPGQKPPIKVASMEKVLPFKPKSVIMMAIEMDYELIKLAPAYTATAAALKGYSQMAFVAPSLARFIQQLGFKAIPFGNDTFRNVPMAIAAGLGEGSRMGVLVTEKFGPRIRLCGVATELELPMDKPVTFGVKEFCEVCMKCADNCPGNAITKEPKPTLDGQHNRSNSVGVKKWHVNAEKCLTFWGKLGIGCSNCISCCPYNKLDTWNHDLAKLATVIPGVRNIARSLDESFGYGKVFNEKAMRNYWKKA
jgi:reductive dehalogenase